MSTLSRFNTAVVTGGGGGLGKVMSQYLISQGKKIIIVGRTESKLQSTLKEVGAAAYYVLDTGDVESIPSFVEKVTSEHPDLDCVINNAGVQRPLSVTQTDLGDFLQKADQEIDINIRGPMHLSLGLLPHLRHKKSAVIMNVTSLLGYIPFSIVNPCYNGTKAWLHFFSMNLRTQLKGTNIKVVEIAPPLVGTDLHRERANPDDNKKDKNSVSLSPEEFMEYVIKHWQKGTDSFGAGMAEEAVERWFKTFGWVQSHHRGQSQMLTASPGNNTTARHRSGIRPQSLSRHGSLSRDGDQSTHERGEPQVASQ